MVSCCGQWCQGNLWTPFAWGEFLYWALYPKVLISMDGRYETLYSAAVFDANYRFYHPPYAIEEADRYPTHYVLAETRMPELTRKLASSGRWHEIYRDSQVVLFGRKASQIAPAHNNRSTTLDALRGDLNRFQLTP